MKTQFIEFLFKRIGRKIGEVRDISSHEEMTMILDDLETYFDTLKEIVVEAVKL